MDKYNMEDLRTVEAQIASLVKTRDKILAGMADENKKQTNDSSQVVCDGMKDFTCVKKLIRTLLSVIRGFREHTANRQCSGSLERRSRISMYRISEM